MEEMQALLNVMGQVVIMVGLGMYMRHKNIITPEVQKSLSTMLLRIILPFSILQAANNPFSEKLAGGLFQAAVIMLVYFVVFLFLTRIILLKMNMPKEEKTMISLMLVFPNVSFLGFPLISGMYGTEYILYPVIANLFYQLALFTYGVYTVAGKEVVNVKWILTDPANICSVLGILLFLSPFRVGTHPSTVFLAETLQKVGGLMVPISMFIIGCMLSDFKLIELIKDRRAYLISFFRLLVIPMIVLVFMKIFQVQNPTATIMVLLCGLPIGTIVAILANQYDKSASFTTRCVIQSMVLMLISVPILLFTCDLVF